jgi:hypothetical protein
MSFESDRQHLLADTILPPPHSSAASFVSVATITDHKERNASLSSSTTEVPDTASIAVQTPYRGFPSEADYLAALRAWAKEKEYVQFDTALIGFYGRKTQEDYLSQPGLGLRKKAKARKEEKHRATTISGESKGGDSAAPVSTSQLSRLRCPRRATLGKLTPTTTT